MESKPVYTALNNQSDSPPEYDSNMPGVPMPASAPTLAPAAVPAQLAFASVAPQPPVYVVQPQVMNHFGSKPSMVVCPSCNARNFSKVSYKSSTKTHLIALVLGITTCCCCIPYCFDSCKSAEHVCSSCGSYVGTYNN
ncbi:lipopolysaccharide-induced tumor necrosis factor-alpha factor homolog [Scaptodrosophila lebanonensis]|uniref:Lipopolysaccharide-induced tumor necrosis factor-alpha factor homolog n=1 Tax=Drosophila lebanonensis TaxID=7225 RepID=A0A6J2UJD9_DROLE|nr:lipopolysaccharide-induced tumor necrosis factor-alpha factor homolog [Scaptodrosophila lebanonensis]